MDHRRVLALLLPASALLLVGVVAVPRAEDLPAKAAAALVGDAAPRAAPAPTPASLDFSPVPAEPTAMGEAHLDPSIGRFVAPLGAGRAILTLDPRLQARLERSLEAYRVPWGATVLLEAATGRVLALAEHSVAEPARKGLALAAFAPA